MKENLVVTSRIYKFVKDYIKANGVKQKYVAKEMGYTETKFSQLINGRKPLQIEDLIKICKYFNISANKFIK